MLIKILPIFENFNVLFHGLFLEPKNLGVKILNENLSHLEIDSTVYPKNLISISKNFQKRKKSEKPIVLTDTAKDMKPILKKPSSEEKSWNKKPKDEKWSKEKSVTFDPKVEVSKFIKLSSTFTKFYVLDHL